MKRLVAAIVMITSAATVCHADDVWQQVGSASTPDSNVNIEVQVASIETTTPDVVRALTRFVRKNPDQPEWRFDPSTQSIESVIDFDCNTSKYEIVQLATVNLSGDKSIVTTESTPSFEAVEPNSLFDGAWEFVCKKERKPK